MKLFLIVGVWFFSSLVVVGIVPPGDPAEADAWYDERASVLDSLIARENKFSRIEGLGEFVMKFGHDIESRTDARWWALFERARSELVSIRGHGEFFSKPVLELQSELSEERYDVRARTEYNRIRTDNFQILGSLKSSEALWVLGGFLHDDRDSPEKLGLSKKVQSQTVRANSFLASWAISRMELTESPISGDELFRDPDKGVAIVRAWWEEVASGETVISFVGTEKQFRFLPDGSTEELKGLASEATARTRPLPTTGNESDSNAETQSLWLVVFLGAIGGVALFFGLRTRRTSP